MTLLLELATSARRSHSGCRGACRGAPIVVGLHHAQLGSEEGEMSEPCGQPGSEESKGQSREESVRGKWDVMARE